MGGLGGLAPGGGMGGAKVPRTPPLGGVAQPDPSAPAPEPDPPETERGFDAENHPLAGVPNVEAGREPLRPSFQHVLKTSVGSASIKI